MPRLLVVALLAGTLTLTACGGGDDEADIAATPAPSSAAPSSAAPSSVGASSAASSGVVTFQGVTVSNPTDLGSKPRATSSATGKPAKLEYKDLKVGTGATAGPTSTVNVQYEGLIYKSGKAFQASWDMGGPISFSLAQVVPGFTQGIGGTTSIAPMKAGGRRIMILPAELGYGATGTPDGSIPPNTPIVFIVDLISVT